MPVGPPRTASQFNQACQPACRVPGPLPTCPTRAGRGDRWELLPPRPAGWTPSQGPSELVTAQVCLRGCGTPQDPQTSRGQALRPPLALGRAPRCHALSTEHPTVAYTCGWHHGRPSRPCPAGHLRRLASPGSGHPCLRPCPHALGSLAPGMAGELPAAWRASPGAPLLPTCPPSPHLGLRRPCVFCAYSHSSSPKGSSSGRVRSAPYTTLHVAFSARLRATGRASGAGAGIVGLGPGRPLLSLPPR